MRAAAATTTHGAACWQLFNAHWHLHQQQQRMARYGGGMCAISLYRSVAASAAWRHQYSWRGM